MKNLKQIVRIVFLLCTLCLATAFKHPLYLSVTELKYNAPEKALQGSVKLFVSDIESALKKTQGKTIDLIHPNDRAQAKAILESYLKTHLSIQINAKSVSYSLLGFEREEESIWAYIEVKKCPLPKKAEIENSLLYDLSAEQTNLVHMEVNGQKKSGRLSSPDKLLSFGFKRLP